MASTSTRLRVLSAALAAATTIAAAGIVTLPGGAAAAGVDLTGLIAAASNEDATVHTRQQVEAEGLVIAVAAISVPSIAQTFVVPPTSSTPPPVTLPLPLPSAPAAKPKAAPAKPAAPARPAARTTTSGLSAGVSPISGAAAKVIADARRYLGARYVWGASGPTGFDCSGLVYRVFADTGLLGRISGSKMSAAGYLAYFRSRGLASTGSARPGDLVIWGNGSHVGIYVGNGMAISALTSGVAVHAISAFTNPFTAYLHTGLD